MTPKEKADELVKKMYVVHTNSESKMVLYFAKQCALIAVDEIIESIPEEPSISTVQRIGSIMFWFEVKQEIEKL
jgi:hypothetical protein